VNALRDYDMCSAQAVQIAAIGSQIGFKRCLVIVVVLPALHPTNIRCREVNTTEIEVSAQSVHVPYISFIVLRIQRGTELESPWGQHNSCVDQFATA
jgi:hypothetical protein